MKSSGATLLAISVLLLSAACHDNSSPTQPQSSLAGSYLLTAKDSCTGAVTTAQVPIEQTGDRINFLLGVDSGSVLGRVHGNTIDFTWSMLSDGGLICGSDLSGSAMIQGRMITGTVSGNANGRSCFACSSDTITFTLARQR